MPAVKSQAAHGALHKCAMKHRLRPGWRVSLGEAQNWGWFSSGIWWLLGDLGYLGCPPAAQVEAKVLQRGRSCTWLLSTLSEARQRAGGGWAAAAQDGSHVCLLPSSSCHTGSEVRWQPASWIQSLGSFQPRGVSGSQAPAQLPRQMLQYPGVRDAAEVLGRDTCDSPHSW